MLANSEFLLLFNQAATDRVELANRNLTAVSTANAKPGDFALYPDSSHIGVVVGRNEAGKLLICHCASGQNNIVITEFSASGFTAVGKLSFMD